jgi:hypothetical protein
MKIQTLAKIRKEFPEYDDISNRELTGLIQEAAFADIDFKKFMDAIEEPEESTTSLKRIEQLLQDLNEGIRMVEAKEPADNTQGIIAILQEVKEQLIKFNKKSFEVKVDAPIVNIPKQDAPIVNIPKQTATPVTITESPKEWTFNIKRDQNGFIQEVTAKA